MRLFAVKHILAVVVLALLSNKAVAQNLFEPFPYVSPGLQIGFTPGEGVFYSVQLTVGVSAFNLNFFRGPLPVGVVGSTLGYRWSKTERMRYLDWQLATILFGVGWGKVSWINAGGPNPKVTSVPRFKAWAGWLINLTYDTYKVKNDARVNNFGLIGAFPIPLVKFSFSS